MNVLQGQSDRMSLFGEGIVTIDYVFKLSLMIYHFCSTNWKVCATKYESDYSTSFKLSLMILPRRT